MSDVQTLLARCRELGAEFIPGPEGKLKVRAPAPLPEKLQAELKRYKAEVLLLIQPARPLPTDSAPAWPCPGCGGPVRLDLPDENLPTRFWACSRCAAWGATRAGTTAPVVWVGGKAVQ